MAEKKRPTPPKRAPEYQPAWGEIVKVEVVEGFRVRDPLSKMVVKTGDHLTYSTYYDRRRREGALRFSRLSGEGGTA